MMSKLMPGCLTNTLHGLKSLIRPVISVVVIHWVYASAVLWLKNKGAIKSIFKWQMSYLQHIAIENAPTVLPKIKWIKVRARGVPPRTWVFKI
jgi:hypothetical protein